MLTLAVLMFRRAAPSTSSSPAPPRCSWRSYSRCWRSTTGPPSPWWPPVTMATRTSWPWWREWRMAPSLAGRRRAWWFSTWRMTPAVLGLNGCWKTTKPRWGGRAPSSAPLVYHRNNHRVWLLHLELGYRKHHQVFCKFIRWSPAAETVELVL